MTSENLQAMRERFEKAFHFDLDADEEYTLETTAPKMNDFIQSELFFALAQQKEERNHELETIAREIEEMEFVDLGLGVAKEVNRKLWSVAALIRSKKSITTIKSQGKE